MTESDAKYLMVLIEKNLDLIKLVWKHVEDLEKSIKPLSRRMAALERGNHKALAKEDWNGED